MFDFVVQIAINFQVFGVQGGQVHCGANHILGKEGAAVLAPALKSLNYLEDFNIS